MKRKAAESQLVSLIRQGTMRVRLPDWPAGQHLRLKFPGPTAVLYEGERKVRPYTIDWDDPNWCAA